MIRCKFVVHEVTKYQSGHKITASPVYSNDPNHENKKFWDATPAGQFSVTVKNESLLAGFDVGTEFYIALEKAPVDVGLADSTK